MKVGAFGLSELHPYIQAENSVGKQKWLVLWRGSKDNVRTCTWYKWKDGSRDPQIWGLKVPSVLLVSVLPGTNLGVVMVMGVGRGTRAHWDSDKVRITELISWLTALMREYSATIKFSHQCPVTMLATKLQSPPCSQPWMLQNLANQSHHKYILYTSDGSSRFLGQTSIHWMLPQLRFHPFSYSWVLSLSRYPPLPLYMIIKPKTLGSASPLCTVTFFCLDLAPWLSYQ